MAKRPRLNPEEAEVLRRKVWLYRARGFSLSKISKIVGRPVSTVSYHLKRARANAYDYYRGAGEEEVVGEMILCHQELRNEALRNLAKTDPASSARLEWLREARQTLKLERELLIDLGLIRKAPDKIDVSVTDFRSMSLDEIRKERARLQQELITTPVRGIDIVDEEADDILVDGDVIDVPKNGKNGKRVVYFDE